MFIRDFQDTIEPADERELDAFLARRYDRKGARVNSFWIWHVDEWPAMGLLVRDDLAYLDYMLEDAAFVAPGGLPGLDPDATTQFWFDDQREWIYNHLVIRPADAARAVREFLHATDLPKSIDWFAL